MINREIILTEKAEGERFLKGEKKGMDNPLVVRGNMSHAKRNGEKERMSRREERMCAKEKDTRGQDSSHVSYRKLEPRQPVQPSAFTRA